SLFIHPLCLSSHRYAYIYSVTLLYSFWFHFFLILRVPPRSTLFPYTTLFRAKVGLADRMWAMASLRFRDVMPRTEQVLAGNVLRHLRMRKSPAEVAALREAGQAIDEVHRQVPGVLRPGRTEREVARDIAEAILATGHATVDFTIVASGPNGASPHHDVSDRVIQPGEPVVVDIGGQMPSGYCSDSTRMYCVGEPPADFAAYYEVLRRAQDAACEAVRPGVSCESIDAAARDIIAEAG